MLVAAGGTPERAPDLREELRRRFAELSADPDDHAELVYADVWRTRWRRAASRRARIGCVRRSRPSTAPGRARAACTRRRTGCSRPSAPAASGSASSRTRSTRPTCFTRTSPPTGSRSGSTPPSSRPRSACESRRPEIYEAALERLGIRPADALFVGDRVREDVQGPAALGMRTCLVTYFRIDAGDHSLADVVASPARRRSARRTVIDRDGKSSSRLLTDARGGVSSVGVN